jgi:hypothetical protein
LLRKLRPADAQDQVTAMLDRDPAACVSLDDPGGVARLLGSLWEVGAEKQVTALADRAILRVCLDDPRAVMSGSVPDTQGKPRRQPAPGGLSGSGQKRYQPPDPLLGFLENL